MPRSSLVLWGPVLTQGRELPPSRVEVADGQIVRLEPGDCPTNVDVVVDAGGWILPGLIDLQVNGAGGVDLTSASDPSLALEQVARTLAVHGVTAFCPTLVSSPRQVILDRLTAYGRRCVPAGAESLGAHVEGPLLDPDHRGVHELGALRLPSISEIQAWLRTEPPTIVTLAPELPGALEAISQLTQAGVIVSLGHSGADVSTAKAGLGAGARMGTHLFNAMPPLHHRQPGLVGALLASGAVLGVIADGVHLDPLTVELVVRLAGPAHVALVSDALAAAGSPPGPSVLGDQAVFSDGRSVRRVDGTLAGSVLLLNGCLHNVRQWLPTLAPADLARMATQTPADLLGLHHKGRVAVGADADLVVLDPEWNVRLSVVGGDVIGDATVEVGA